MAANWIFIRGMQREAGHFGDFGAAFEAALPGARVRFLDLPGNGENFQVRTPLTVREMTERIRAQADERGYEKPYVLALSLGGMVACDWAQRYRDELAGIVLVNTSFGGYSPPWHRFQLGAIPTTFAVARERDPFTREMKLMPLASSRTEAYEATAARWAGIARARPVSKQNSFRQLLAAARFRPSREKPSVPHLLLVGGRDRLCSPRCSAEIVKAWGGPMEVHATAGHDLTLDAAPWMIEKISAWLNADKTP